MGVKLKSVSNWSNVYRFYLGWEGQPFHGGGHDNPLQYSCLENPKDRGVWQAHIDSTTFISNLFCFILFWTHHLPYLQSWKKWKKVLVTQSCPTLCNPMDCSPPGSSVEFSRQECWSGFPFPSPGDLLHPGTECRSPALQVDSLPAEPPGTHLLY